MTKPRQWRRPQAVPLTCHHDPHVQAHHHHVSQGVWHVAVSDPVAQALHHCSLAHTTLSQEHWVVLGAPACMGTRVSHGRHAGAQGHTAFAAVPSAAESTAAPACPSGLFRTVSQSRPVSQHSSMCPCNLPLMPQLRCTLSMPPPAEDVDAAPDLLIAPHHRVQLALAGRCSQVLGVLLKWTRLHVDALVAVPEGGRQQGGIKCCRYSAGCSKPACSAARFWTQQHAPVPAPCLQLYISSGAPTHLLYSTLLFLMAFLTPSESRPSATDRISPKRWS